MTWKPFITRLIIFLILLYAIIPAGIYKIGTKPLITINAFYVPIAAAGMLFAFILLKKEEIKNFQYTFSWKQTFLFGILAYCLFTAYLVQQNQYWEHRTAHLLTGYALYMIGGILLLLAVYNTKFVKHFIKPITASLILIIAYSAGSLLLNLLGYPLTRIISIPLAKLLSLTNTVTMTVDYAPTLQADTFSATIGPPCTGITSLILYTGLFIFAALLDWKRINKKTILAIYLLGAIGMFIIAFLRLWLLYLVGANWSASFAMKGFHTNAGWILFVAYFAIYFWITYPKMINIRR